MGVDLREHWIQCTIQGFPVIFEVDPDTDALPLDLPKGLEFLKYSIVSHRGVIIQSGETKNGPTITPVNLLGTLFPATHVVSGEPVMLIPYDLIQSSPIIWVNLNSPEYQTLKMILTSFYSVKPASPDEGERLTPFEVLKMLDQA